MKLQTLEIISNLLKQLNLTVWSGHKRTSSLTQRPEFELDTITLDLSSKCTNPLCNGMQEFTSRWSLTSDLYQSIEHPPSLIYAWALRELQTHHEVLADLHAAKFYSLKDPAIQEALKQLNNNLMCATTS